MRPTLRILFLRLIGGAIFNLANLLLVAAIDMAGLAVAFPISIGIALVVGTLLNYILQPKGNLAFLAVGVACALIAVILDGKAYGSLAARDGRFHARASSPALFPECLMGLWSPFMTHGTTRGNALTPYSSAVFLTLGALLSCFIWNIYFMKTPAGRASRSASADFSAGPPRDICWDCWADASGEWERCSILVAGKFTGFAISYAIGQSAPMVAALWGILVWKEFANSGPQAKVYLATHVRVLRTGDFPGRASEWLSRAYFPLTRLTNNCKNRSASEASKLAHSA